MLRMMTCSRCGARSQVLDLGRPRCFACGGDMVDEPPPPSDTYPVTDPADPPPPPRRLGDRPLCPRCHRPGAIHDGECGYCGYLFGQGVAYETRRDRAAHRGPLIEWLGATALWAAWLSVVAAFVGAVQTRRTGMIEWWTGGLIVASLGLVVALLAGLPAWSMSSEDLSRMDTGEVDPEGRHQTERGRRKAGLGIGLALLVWAGALGCWLSVLS